MDLLSLGTGFLASVWGALTILYPRDIVWFHKKWLDYLEARLLPLSLSFIGLGVLSLYIVWATNRFLLLLVIGSWSAYTGLKHLLFGKRVLDLSRQALGLPDWRRQLSGAWLVVGGMALIWLSSWF